MTRLSRTLYFACVALFLAACQPSPTAEEKLLRNSSQWIVDNHQRFATASTHFEQASHAFCASPSAENLEAARSRWVTAMSAWQSVKLTNFGPLSVGNQSWKIQFWPDKKNLIRRKSLELMNSDDAITVDRLGGASVVVQGLSAAEYLLFDPQEGQLNHFTEGDLAYRRCELLQAIAGHTHQVSKNLHQQWISYAETLANPSEENPEYKTPQASISVLVDSLAAALEVAKQQQLAMPLGYRQKSKRGRPYFGEAWRSQHSRELLIANLESVKALFSLADQYGLEDYLRDTQHADLAKTLSDLMSAAIKETEQSAAFFTAVTDKEQRLQLDHLYQTLGELLSTVKNDLPPALGVQLGFNSNDGD